MAEKWGMGQAKLVKPSTSASSESVVFLSDLHIPYQDTEAVASALRFIRKYKPDRVVINGDVADFFQLSRFNTQHQRLDSLQRELDEANAFRVSLRKAAPNTFIDETEGNHDSRIKTYVANNARALVSLSVLEPESLFRYRDLEITAHPGAGFLLRKNFLVKHGTLIRQDAGASAKAEFNQAGVSGVSGHTHRLAKYIKAGYTHREWSEQGCLCQLNPDYVVGAPNWVQGIAVGEFSTKTDSFSVELLQIIDGKIRYGGKAI